MNTRPTKLFDDRLLMLIGAPLISLIVVLFFIKQTPQAVGWSYFLATCCISFLYTMTYWIIARWTMIFWRKRKPGIPQTKNRITFTILSLIVLVLSVELICIYIAGWEDIFRTSERNLQNILATGPVSMILVVAMTGVYEAIYFFKLYRIAEVDKERLLRSQVENQLEVLRKQVDPHFLFNSLNTLVSLIPENPAAAQEFTERLSATYRRLLEWRQVEKATLAQELEALNDYIHLMEVRFEDRLQVNVNIDSTLSDFYIAPLALQLLVENAVKHNEASMSHPLVVDIYTKDQAIHVANKKRLKGKLEVDSTGFGLENLKDRVNYLTERKLVVSNTADTFSVSVPLLEMAPTPQYSSPQKTSV